MRNLRNITPPNGSVARRLGFTRDLESQLVHDMCVRQVVELLENQGWRVLADHVEGYDKPPKINGFRPDVLATSIEGNILVEVETGETAVTIRARDQIRAFRKWADENVGERLHDRRKCEVVIAPLLDRFISD